MVGRNDYKTPESRFERGITDHLEATKIPHFCKSVVKLEEWE